MELIMLGTGSAMVTKCYNTCFALRREEEYFLMDLDSTNGTYINGKRLGGDGMEKLQQGDRISFADLEYIFQLQ